MTLPKSESITTNIQRVQLPSRPLCPWRCFTSRHSARAWACGEAQAAEGAQQLPHHRCRTLAVAAGAAAAQAVSGAAVRADSPVLVVAGAGAGAGAGDRKSTRLNSSHRL